ncbi:MAG TPA: type II secretion system protein N [Steroidobacteraceae bacterium]|nr:type II secretion system protein N [Steroidobacteraceae bacterium]
MSRRASLIAAGTAAFAVFLVAMIPAAQLTKRLPAGYAMTGVAGTIWSGQAAELRIEGRAVGAIDWFCRPWHLVMLRWSCRATLKPPGGRFTADLSGNFDGDGLEATNVQGQSPIAAFEGIATPAGWTGRLELDLGRIRIIERRAGEAAGKLFVRELRAPGASGAQLGDFELVVGEGAVGTEMLTGRLRDLGGPLRVRGAIELQSDGRYFLSGEVAPGPGAGPAIFDTLSFLGPPDASGRRPFSVEGTL